MDPQSRQGGAARPSLGLSTDPAPKESSPYGLLGEVTTGRAAADLATYLDASATQDIRQARDELAVSTVRAVAAARNAAAHSVRTAHVTGSGATMARLVAPAEGSLAVVDPSLLQSTQVAVAETSGGALVTADAALESAIAAHLVEVAVYRHSLALSQGTRGPDASLRNII